MGVFTFVKAGKQLFNTIKGVQPKVNKTKLDTAKTNLALGKQKLKSLQLSERGGEMFCIDKGDRVLINGKAKTYSVGEVFL